VKPPPFQYHAPTTLREALELLDSEGPDAKPLAGGQSLIPMMNLRLAWPPTLVDVNRVHELGGVRLEAGRLCVGAIVRQLELERSELVREHCPLLGEALRFVGHPATRARGTVAGSLAHADPAGDWPTALMTLDTTVTIAGRGTSRTMPLADFIVDAYTTRLGAGEMVTQISVGVPPRPGGGAYVKFEKRAGDFAVASVGVQLTLDGDRCRGVAISLGAVGATPIRASAERRTAKLPP